MFLKEVLRYDSRVPPLTNQNLFARDLNMCGYCNRRFKVENLSRDHIIPVSKGGKNVWGNVITSCKPCNHEKADLPLGKAVDVDGDKMVLQFKPYIPSHIERLIMQHRHIQTDQFDFLYTMLPNHSRLKQVQSYIEDVIEVPTKRHFYSATEISSIKHAEEVSNSQNRRRKVPKF